MEAANKVWCVNERGFELEYYCDDFFRMVLTVELSSV